MVENRGPQVLGVAASFGPLALSFVLLRCYVRIRITKAFGLDDYFMVLSLMGYLTYTTAGIYHGDYEDKLTIPPLLPENTDVYHIYWIGYIAYSVAMTCAKISIGVFLLRLTVYKVHRIIIWIAMAVTTLSGIVFLFVTFFECSPVQFFWTRWLGVVDGHCLSPEVIAICSYCYGATCALCDFIFGLLPVVLITKLQMERSMKFMLVPILSIACIASCAVVIRIPYTRFFTDADFLYATVPIAVWSIVECGLAITAGCVVTLYPLYKQVIEHLTTKGVSSEEPDYSDGTPNRYHKRPGVFSLSHLTTRCKDDEEENPREGALRLEERDTTSLKNAMTPIHVSVRKDFKMIENESLERQVTNDSRDTLQLVDKRDEHVIKTFVHS
ncbi:hypothetical protein EJ05DRAFT_499641 [Pseudovirgaria hyperparasitica]|uniref:Rhodopsin domain-containing protein n=1 Tax=Pseudovirgaria hyperparasitica TaxID=470096 RepID=A0A6A6WDN7_9PEZI|nr:uncharacterized protein EJ05DRAFT_499641 [Pseudovirgaria hyperparasitica]KAF2759221.1 hypothetical protein EJ05DRAFT_499641 [Pseudovirgaria hyperparasitica]